MHTEDELDLEATEEQLEALREFGIPEHEFAGMSMADAEQLIAELRAEREIGR